MIITHYKRTHVPTGMTDIMPFIEQDMMKRNQDRIELVDHWNWLGNGVWIYEVAR